MSARTEDDGVAFNVRLGPVNACGARHANNNDDDNNNNDITSLAGRRVAIPPARAAPTDQLRSRQTYYYYLFLNSARRFRIPYRNGNKVQRANNSVKQTRTEQRGQAMIRSAETYLTGLNDFVLRTTKPSALFTVACART